MDYGSDLSIIIPNRNEINIGITYKLTTALFPEAEVIVSTDIDGRGKGWALREGFKQSTKKNIAFLDGDLDIAPTHIRKLIQGLERNDICVGVKNITYLPIKRKLISHLCRLIVKTLFRMPVTDTQTGVKAFKRYALSNWDTDGFACDIEILYNAHKQGYKIGEVPIYCYTSRPKGLKILWDTLVETLRIWFRLSSRYGKMRI